MDIGEGLANFGQSIGGALEKSAKVKRNAKLLETLKSGLSKVTTPEAKSELEVMFSAVDPSEDVLSQIATMTKLQEAMAGIKLKNTLLSDKGAGQAGTPYIEDFTVDGVKYKIPPTPEVIAAKAKNEMDEANVKPLSGESATRYGGVTQGIGNIKKITETLEGLDEKTARNLIYRANKGVLAANARDTFVPGATGAYQMWQRGSAGDEGLSLAKEFMTLSENLLRARTGAQAPEPEMVREYARTLLNSFYESPKTWKSKLQTNLDFLKGVGKEIRPLREKEWGYNLENKTTDKPLSKEDALAEAKRRGLIK